MKPNPPVNILLGDTAKRLENPEKVKMLYRDVLAERLGVAPIERLTLTLIQNDDRILVSALVDGGDLTPAQEKVFRAPHPAPRLIGAVLRSSTTMKTRFLNVAVETEVRATLPMFIAWCLTHGGYDDEIEPLHNPDWVRTAREEELKHLADLKTKIETIEADF